MKIGDLVISYRSDSEIGVVLDCHETDDGLWYFEIQWKHERQWFGEDELKVISESQ